MKYTVVLVIVAMLSLSASMSQSEQSKDDNVPVEKSVKDAKDVQPRKMPPKGDRDVQGSGKGNGNAYGKDKALTDEELGQHKPSEARAEKNPKTEAEVNLVIKEIHADSREHLSIVQMKLDQAKAKLDELRKSREISPEDFDTKHRSFQAFKERKADLLNKLP